jgi:histidinol-phosphate phosphatase family protein
MEGPYVQVPSPLPSNASADAPIAFLDRDGVINRGKSGYVNGPDEVILLPGAAHSIGMLNQEGYLVCVVTNQSPIARGLWTPANLGLIHKELQRQLFEEDPQAEIHAFLTCPHRFEDACNCRKPSPSMLFLGHQVLREGVTVQTGWEPVNHVVFEPQVNWWGPKPSSPHPLDLMVGDRRSDMGAGWGFGARLYRVPAAVGLSFIGNRWADKVDFGDSFQP